ncbi:ATP-binding protein [Arthrobacter sp. Leaf137]|uniref:AAA family ATPase n=1 Tax=Arthrobacter sp. Leaf137 TaxID=1736271 RepID=UPI0006F77E5C|nr:ATP-binding protein [Arthrobacter sp. Leaf137]KQQ81455.1 aminoglycoside phosphotransferase [Arthrobacter sp. Leaf137]
MCGPAGAGKSTLSRRFEREGMVRLSFDEVAWEMGLRTMPLDAETQRVVEASLQERVAALVKAGADIVLDFSFWSRRMREDYRNQLRPLGVEPETIYLATPRSVALARIRARRADHAHDFCLREEVAAQYFDQFEVPTGDEGPLTVIGPHADSRPDD